MKSPYALWGPRMAVLNGACPPRGLRRSGRVPVRCASSTWALRVSAREASPCAALTAYSPPIEQFCRRSPGAEWFVGWATRAAQQRVWGWTRARGEVEARNGAHTTNKARILALYLAWWAPPRDTYKEGCDEASPWEAWHPSAHGPLTPPSAVSRAQFQGALAADTWYFVSQLFARSQVRDSS